MRSKEKVVLAVLLIVTVSVDPTRGDALETAVMDGRVAAEPDDVNK